MPLCSALQAAQAYDVAQLKMHGPGAALNFPRADLQPVGPSRALDMRPTSAGSGASSTEAMLNALASMTPQSGPQPPGHGAAQVDCDPLKNPLSSL